MSLRQINLQGTTDASGDVVITDTGHPDDGKFVEFLYAVEWVDGDLADGVDAVLSCVGGLSGVTQTLLTLTNANSDAWYYPRTLEDDQAGAESTGFAYPVINGVLTLTISSGGNAKTGGAIVYTFK